MVMNARFIEQYGTHVVIGVSMGGKDVMYLRQSHPSNIQPFHLQELLKNKADARFMDSAQNISEDIYDQVLYLSLFIHYVLCGFKFSLAFAHKFGHLLL